MKNRIQSEDSPEYQVAPALSTLGEDAIVNQAIAILQSRFKPGAPMSSPQTTKNYLMATETTDGVEVFRVLWLDAQHRIITVETLSVGTLTQASVYPREVLKSALLHQAAACIMSHNHPSGTVEESEADKALTRHLKTALAMIDVRLLDHVITSHGKCMSFAERGIL